MLRITEKSNEIIIREVPVAKYFSSLFSAMGVFILIFGISKATVFSHMSWILGSAAFIVSSLWLQLKAPVTTIKINKPGKTVAVRKQSLVKYSFKVYSFHEIINFIYVESSDVTASQLVMPLKDDLKIRLSAAGGSKDNDYLNAVDQMNTYIFGRTSQIPFKLTLLNLD